MQRRRGPSILDSAWLSESIREKLLLHGEAASDDGPPARATNSSFHNSWWKDRRWEEAVAVSGQIFDHAEVFACVALRDGSLPRASTVYHIAGQTSERDTRIECPACLVAASQGFRCDSSPCRASPDSAGGTPPPSRRSGLGGPAWRSGCGTCLKRSVRRSSRAPRPPAGRCA